MNRFTTALFYFLTVLGHLLFNGREVEELVEGPAVQFCHSFLEMWYSPAHRLPIVFLRVSDFNEGSLSQLLNHLCRRCCNWENLILTMQWLDKWVIILLCYKKKWLSTLMRLMDGGNPFWDGLVATLHNFSSPHQETFYWDMFLLREIESGGLHVQETCVIILVTCTEQENSFFWSSVWHMFDGPWTFIYHFYHLPMVRFAVSCVTDPSACHPPTACVCCMVPSYQMWLVSSSCMFWLLDLVLDIYVLFLFSQPFTAQTVCVLADSPQLCLCIALCPLCIP